MGYDILFMFRSLSSIGAPYVHCQLRALWVFSFNRSLICSIAQLKNSVEAVEEWEENGELKNSSNNQLQQQQQHEEEQKARTDNAANWQRNEEKTETGTGTENGNGKFGEEETTLKREAELLQSAEWRLKPGLFVRRVLSARFRTALWLIFTPPERRIHQNMATRYMANASWQKGSGGRRWWRRRRRGRQLVAGGSRLWGCSNGSSFV